MAVLTALFALGWSSLLRLPARGGSTLVVILAGLGGLACVAVTPEEPWLRYLPIVLAMSVFLAFINEMLRAYPRINLVESLIGTVSGVVVAMSAVGWLAGYKLDGGVELTAAAAGALAVASAASALRVPRYLSRALAIVAATMSAIAVSVLMDDLSMMSGVVIGVSAGLIVVSNHLLFGKLSSAKREIFVDVSRLYPHCGHGNLDVHHRAHRPLTTD
ncbi:hypothetical protein [Timonella sp. A28]|uniref:hypothetical protein n=1 Tax=Timonella sp. A28 TaxID=3442640 RepID=UPI003EB6A5DF